MSEPSGSRGSPPPWASFCIATYKRPDHLRRALAFISQQTFTDFEVIVSDNDPEQSSREVVLSASDPRFRYFANERNLGMVKNFNAALGRARGHFVVMVTDDDPVYPELLATLHSLSLKHPGYGAYFGACGVQLETEEMARTYDSHVGFRACLANGPLDSVRLFSAAEFPHAFFERRVFPYFLWSTGVVKRSVALAVGGMPDYGSPYLTDFGYVALVGSSEGMVALNTVLGHQSVHGSNSGFSDPHGLVEALDGGHRYLTARLSSRIDWRLLRLKMERYIGLYVLNHALAMERYYKIVAVNPERAAASSAVICELFQIGYIRRLKVRYWLLRLGSAAPGLRGAYRHVKAFLRRVSSP